MGLIEKDVGLAHWSCTANLIRSAYAAQTAQIVGWKGRTRGEKKKTKISDSDDLLILQCTTQPLRIRGLRYGKNSIPDIIRQYWVMWTAFPSFVGGQFNPWPKGDDIVIHNLRMTAVSCSWSDADESITQKASSAAEIGKVKKWWAMTRLKLAPHYVFLIGDKIRQNCRGFGLADRGMATL